MRGVGRVTLHLELSAQGSVLRVRVMGEAQVRVRVWG